MHETANPSKDGDAKLTGLKAMFAHGSGATERDVSDSLKGPLAVAMWKLLR